MGEEDIPAIPRCNANASTAWYLLMALSGLVIVQSSREMLSSIYYFGLVEMGPSPQIAALAVVGAPLLAIPLTRWMGWRGAIILTGAAMALFRLPMGFGLDTPLHLVFSTITYASSGSFLVIAMAIQRRERSVDPDVFSSQGATGALSLSLLFQVVLVSIGSGLDVSIVPEVSGMMLSPSLSFILAGGIGFLLRILANAPVLDPKRSGEGMIGGAITGGGVDSVMPFVGLGSFLAFSGIVLLHPSVVSTWLGIPAGMAYSMTLLSVSLFIMSLFSTWRPLIGMRISFGPPKGSVMANLLLVAAALNLTVFRVQMPFAPMAITWISLIDLWLCIDAMTDTEPFAGEPVVLEDGKGKVRLLGLASRKRKGTNPGTIVRRLSISFALMVLFPVLVVLTLNWAFLPGLGLLKGSMPLVMLLPALVLACSGFMCSKKGIEEPCLQEQCRGLPRKGSPAVAAGSGSGHPVSASRPKRRLGREWMVMGTITAALVILGSIVVYSGEGSRDLTGPGGASDRLVVMTYNVHQGFCNSGRADPAPIMDAIKEADPDVLFLQETNALQPAAGNYDLAGHIAGSLDMDVVQGPGPWEGTYGVAILARFQLVDPHVHMLTSKVEQKYFLSCSAKIGNELLTLVSVHLGQDEADRPVQMEELAEYLGNVSGRVLLGGDLNAGPSDPEMERFNSTLFGPDGAPAANGGRSPSLDLLSAWHCSPVRNLPIDAHTFPASGLDEERVHIDYILLGPGIEVLEATIDDRSDASDHRPLIARIDLVPEG